MASSRQQPWHGVLVATALPFRADLTVDLDRYAEHVRWLADNGCDGVCPNGSLGEYQVLTTEERAAVVRTAVEAAPPGFTVMPGVGAYGAREARAWAEQAAETGAQVVMALPPNAFRGDDRAVMEHYREIAKAGLPVSAYNNPIDTKIDLRPSLLAEMYDEGLIVAVKDFTGEARRSYDASTTRTRSRKSRSTSTRSSRTSAGSASTGASISTTPPTTSISSMTGPFT